MKKIVLTGPESTGKTTLMRYLGAAFHAPYQIECSREYLESFGPKYTLRDLYEMAKMQFYQRDKQAPFRPDIPYLICDTDAVVFQIWAKDKFGVHLDLATEDLRKYPAELYLLCRPDLPWEPDPLRENRHDRDRLFNLYRRYLDRHRLPYGIVEGTGAERFECATRTIEQRLGLERQQLPEQLKPELFIRIQEENRADWRRRMEE